MSNYQEAVKDMTIEKAKDIMLSSGLDTATMMWINSQLDQLTTVTAELDKAKSENRFLSGVISGMENAENEKLEQVTAEREAMREALSECVNVLQYIGNGVSAHFMAKQYARMYRKRLSDDEYNAGYNRVKARYDYLESLTGLQNEHNPMVTRE